MSKHFKNATKIQDAEGHLYHIDLKRGELAERILLVGSSERARRAAGLFDSVEFERAHRGYLSFTGQYCGERVSVFSIGMGQGSAEIALAEILQITDNPVFIRIGTCGALNPDIKLGDMVISTAAVRMGNVEDYYVSKDYPAIAHHEVIAELKKLCGEQDITHHVGITASAPGFYSPQAREIEGLPCRKPDVIDELRSMNVLNFEMESSVVFVLSALRQCKSGCMCLVLAQRDSNEVIDSDLLVSREIEGLKIGLKALLNLTPEAI